jgi:predicted Co/Zn/Cd cation transporter (cation efflux family)
MWKKTQEINYFVTKWNETDETQPKYVWLSKYIRPNMMISVPLMSVSVPRYLVGQIIGSNIKLILIYTPLRLKYKQKLKYYIWYKFELK